MIFFGKVHLAQNADAVAAGAEFVDQLMEACLKDNLRRHTVGPEEGVQRDPQLVGSGEQGQREVRQQGEIHAVAIFCDEIFYAVFPVLFDQRSADHAAGGLLCQRNPPSGGVILRVDDPCHIEIAVLHHGDQ